MTVANESNFTTYPGDDIAVTFPFNFPVYDAEHLKVYLQDTTTKVLLLVSDTDYSATGIGDEEGGSITLDDPVSSDNRLIIARIVPLTQDLDVLNQGGFYPENVEAEFDLQEMQTQQLQEQIDRSVRGQITEDWPDLPPPPERAGKLLGFTDDDDAFPTVDTTDILVSMLAAILQAGTGISITVGDGIITITNTAPGGGESGTLQDCWLLENDTTGGGGDSSGDAEFVRDTIAAALVGVGCTITHNDPADTITITVTGAVDIEGVYDAIAAAITAGNGISVSSSDGGNTTTISADPEYIRDTIGTALAGAKGIAITVDDAGNTITIKTKANILTVVSAATVTATSAYDQVNITAQAAALNLANPTGSFEDGDALLYRIKDNGTARAITYNGGVGSKFRAFNEALPTTTIISKLMYVGFIYNAADDKFDCMGVKREA